MRRSTNTALWLIGIGVLALTGWWWPGIMFLVALSALVNGSLQGFIWLAGIGLLALFDFWWPGILILTGIGLLVGGLRGSVRQVDFDEAAMPADPLPLYQDDSTPAEAPPVAAIPAPSPGPDPSTNADDLPPTCPACGGPVNEMSVEWRTNRAYCGFCGTALGPQTTSR